MNFALRDASGRVIGAMDTVAFSVVNNTARSLRTLRRPVVRRPVIADTKIDRTMTMASVIKGYGRLGGPIR